MTQNKTAVLYAIVIMAVAPYITWLSLYVASRTTPRSLAPALSVLGIARSTARIAGLLLVAAHFFAARVPLVVGSAFLLLYAGLFYPERWLKRQLGIDTNENAAQTDWWPSKREW